MPRDINGNATWPNGSIVNLGDDVLPSQHNPPIIDTYALLTDSLSRKGFGGMLANLNLSGFKIVNLAPATNPGDAVRLSQITNVTPLGTVVDFAGSTAPDGWLFCFGQAVSRVDFAGLFAIVGTAYGIGDGSTTFNLPDLRGRVSAGRDDMGGTSANRLTGLSGGVNGDDLGGAGGSESHTLTTGQLAVHDHGDVTAAGGHSHGFLSGGSNASVWRNTASQNAGGTTKTILSLTNDGGDDVWTRTVANHQHATLSAGSGQAHNNVQPTLILNKIIKAVL